MRIFILLLTFGIAGLNASQKIVVDLSQQIAFAYENGKLQFYGRISTGKPGRRTPTGRFTILEKDIDHVSNLWPAPNGGAKMHYMLRLTRDGVAMHLGPVPDYPASHGCIRMQDGFAQKMYFWAKKGIPVTVTGIPPARSPRFKLSAFSSEAERQRYHQATQAELAAEAANRRLSALEQLSSNHKRHTVKKQTVPKATPVAATAPLAEAESHPATQQKSEVSVPTPPPETTLDDLLEKQGIPSRTLAEISSSPKVKKILKESRKEAPRPRKKATRPNPLKVMRGG